MKRHHLILSNSFMIAFVALSSQAWAQQKAAKDCIQEWRADKAGFQAKGITEKAYVAACRTGTAPTPTATTPASTPAPTTRTAAPTPATANPPSATPAAKPTVTTARPAPAPVGPAGDASSPAGQFTTEAEAKASCVGDTVVWVTLPSKIYHYSGTRNYGTTKHGAYVCEKQTAALGMRPSKNEKRP